MAKLYTLALAQWQDGGRAMDSLADSVDSSPVKPRWLAFGNSKPLAFAQGFATLALFLALVSPIV